MNYLKHFLLFYWHCNGSVISSLITEIQFYYPKRAVHHFAIIWKTVNGIWSNTLGLHKTLLYLWCTLYLTVLRVTIIINKTKLCSLEVFVLFILLLNLQKKYLFLSSYQQSAICDVFLVYNLFIYFFIFFYFSQKEKGRFSVTFKKLYIFFISHGIYLNFHHFI